MTILVIGGTGNFGSHVVKQLATRNVEVKALVHTQPKGLPENVTPVKGDLDDIDSMRAALVGIKTLFLLNAVCADELTKAQLALNLAMEAGVKNYVYFSMLNSDVFDDVPHAAAKFTVEKMIQQHGLAATILRPTYFFDNDKKLKSPILVHGVYPTPIGERGVSMVDARDLGEIAAIKLVDRESSAELLPPETIEIVGPDMMTGTSIAKLWSDVVKRPVSYGGDDIAGFEKAVREQHAPSWMAYDTSLMFRRFLSNGMLPKANSLAQLTKMLGHAPRSYRSFAEETYAEWQHPSFGEKAGEILAGATKLAGDVIGMKPKKTV